MRPCLTGEGEFSSRGIFPVRNAVIQTEMMESEFCSLRISFVERMGNGDASISSSVIPEEFAKGAETRRHADCTEAMRMGSKGNNQTTIKLQLRTLIRRILGGGSGRVCGSSLVGQVEQPRLPPSSRGGAGGSLKDCNRKYKVPVHYPPLSTRLFSHSVDSSTEDHP